MSDPRFSCSRLTFSAIHAPYSFIPPGVAAALSVGPASRSRSASISDRSSERIRRGILRCDGYSRPSEARVRASLGPYNPGNVSSAGRRPGSVRGAGVCGGSYSRKMGAVARIVLRCSLRTTAPENRLRAAATRSYESARQGRRAEA